jgi:tRNA nucleotidyltransferase (CCA-adding enzyme)
VHLVRHHLFHYDGWSDAAMRRWIRRVGVERVEELCVLSTADLIAKGPAGDPDYGRSIEALRAHVARVLAEGAALSRLQLAVDGHELMRVLGLPPGRLIGRILDELLEAVLAEPALNTRDELLERARVIAARGVTGSA